MHRVELLKEQQTKHRMQLNRRLCVMLVVLFGDVLAEGNIIQAANPSKLSPDRRAAVEERCHRIRRDCIATGDLFRRSVVCGGGGKRFINECALQLRSCDLLLDTGEEILQERCFWVVKEDESEKRPVTKVPPTSYYYTTSGSETTTSRIIVDYFYTSPFESTRVSTNNPSTEELATTQNEQTTVRHSTRWPIIDYGATTDSYNPSWMPEFTTKDSGRFKPPGDIAVRTCCRGDTPCDSCLRENKGGRVCGSDGKTYDTECALDNEACDSYKEWLVVESPGSCKPDHRNDHSPGKPPRRGDLGKRQI